MSDSCWTNNHNLIDIKQRARVADDSKIDVKFDVEELTVIRSDVTDVTGNKHDRAQPTKQIIEMELVDYLLTIWRWSCSDAGKYYRTFVSKTP